MECKNCGEKVAVFSRYCENCGEKALTTSAWWLYMGKSALSTIKKKLWLVAVIALIVVALIGIGIWRNAASIVDPTDYVITTVSGFDGNGNISVEMDFDALLERVLGSMPSDDTPKGHEDKVKYLEDTETIKNALSVQVDRSMGLKNGDYYQVTISILDPKAFDKHKVDLKNSVYQKTLQIGTNSAPFDKAIDVDLFEYINIGFNGTDGNGYVVLPDTARNDELTLGSGRTLRVLAQCYESWSGYVLMFDIADEFGVSIPLYIREKNGLTNGEMITVTLDEEKAKQLEDHGIRVTVLTKEYQVSGLEK